MDVTKLHLRPFETKLVGVWALIDGVLRADDVCKRIEFLTQEVMTEIAHNSKSGEWETLYFDPDHERYWEKTFPESGGQGGGPPMLTYISEDEAIRKYKLDTI